jgi:hypothetical protein
MNLVTLTESIFCKYKSDAMSGLGRLVALQVMNDKVSDIH